MQYKVSVIIPVYNAEKYLVECFDSLVNQTIKDIQIIAVDDGSKDSSADICKEYSDKYDNFEYYYKENGGSASARNYGLDYATGEYIGFVDADDWVEPHMYEKLYNTAKENDDTDIVFCRVFEDECPGSNDYYFPDYGYYNKQQVLEKILPYTVPFVTEKGNYRSIRWCNWLRIHKKSIIDENNIRFFAGSRRCEDLGFTLECTMHADSFYYLNESLYHNRPNLESKSRNYSKQMWKSIRALMMYFVEITKDYKDCDLKACIDYAVFYFCTMTIKNELKNSNSSEMMKNISQVINDQVCRENLKVVSPNGMNEEYATLFGLMKERNVKGVLDYLKKRESRKKSVFSKLLKNRAVNKLYKIIRRR